MSQDEQAPIERLGKYEILGVAGKGAQGIVLKGHDPFVDRDVAIKLCRLDGLPEDTRSTWRRFFFNEAQAAGHLDHPNILRVYDAGLHDEEPYMVMEYVHGADTLRSYIDRDALLPPEEAIGYVRQCAEALDYAHGRGVTHRDVKPANLMLTVDRQVKLVDFGIAQRSDTDKTQVSGSFGSPRYMSPEQARGEDVGTQSDLFSLGIVLYELLTGAVPFEATNVPAMIFKIVNEDPVPIRERDPSLPDALVAIVERALAKDLDRRYATGAQMAADLAEAQALIEAPEAALGEEQKLALMRELSFFADFADEELEEVLDESVWATHRARTTILADGTENSTLYILVRGRARVEKGGVSVIELEPGACFGELGFMEGLAQVGSVVPSERATVLTIVEPVKVWGSMACQLRFNARLQHTMAQRLAEMTRRVVEVHG